MAESTARVAGLGTTTVAAAVATTVATTLGAVTSNVSDLAALVALLTTAHGTTTGSGALGAVARDVTGLTTAVAGLLLLGVGALAREMALATAVVAGGVALGGAVASLVGNVAACSEADQYMVLCVAGEAYSSDRAHLHWHVSSRQMAIAQVRAVTARVKKTYSCSKRGQSWEERGHRSSAC